jgi:hypothetical protein
MDHAEILLYVILPLCAAVAGLCIACCISDCKSRRGELRRQREERNAAELARRVLEDRVAAVAARARMAAAQEYRRSATAAAPIVVTKKLGHFPYSAAAAEAGRGASGECAICLEMFVQGAECSEAPACRHLFHQECIEKSMTSRSTCPLCRADIVPGSEPFTAAEVMV